MVTLTLGVGGSLSFKMALNSDSTIAFSKRQIQWHPDVHKPFCNQPGRIQLQSATISPTQPELVLERPL